MLVPILLLSLCFTGGCFEPKATTINTNGIPMVSVEDASSLLGLTCAVENGSIILRQDQIVLKIEPHQPYVRKDGFIMYIMEKPAAYVKGGAYLPVSLLTDYFKVTIKADENNRLFIARGTDLSLYKIVKFLPQEVSAAINDENDPNRDKLLEQVELPRSMDIKIPKINMDRVIVTTPLSQYSNVFKNDLIQHGYGEKEIATFSYNDYCLIQSTWKLPNAMVKSFKKMCPELSNRDLSAWTYGDYEKYYTQQDKVNFESSFTEEQKKQFKQRGILLDDVHYLYKDFYTIDTILSQPDEVLKKTLKQYYQFSIDMLNQ